MTDNQEDAMTELNEHQWHQVSGDMCPETYGGIFARLDGDNIELFSVDPVLEHQSVLEAEEVGAPFWRDEASYDPEDLEFNSDSPSVLSYVGEPETKERWYELEPVDRAVLLFQYGIGKDHSTCGFALQVLPSDPVIGWGSEDDIRLDFLETDVEFLREVLGKSELFLCSVGTTHGGPTNEPFLVEGRQEAALWVREVIDQDTEDEDKDTVLSRWRQNPFQVKLEGHEETVTVEPFTTLVTEDSTILSEASELVRDFYNGDFDESEGDELDETDKFILETAEKQPELQFLAVKLLEVRSQR